MGKDLTVKFIIHGVEGIPEQLSTEVYVEYKWIDE